MPARGNAGIPATNNPTPKPDTTATILNNSAQRYNIPAWILWGVFGLESGWGKNGNNWFGLVSVPRSSYGVDGSGKHYDSGGKTTFSGDADIAAKTLSDIFYGRGSYATAGGKGSWDHALSVYNVGKPTGGYTAKRIKAVFDARPKNLYDYTPGGLEGAIQDIATGPVGDVAQAASDALSVPAQFLKLITSLDFWLRLGEGIAGLILLAMGLKTLTGFSIPLPPVVPV